MLGDAVVQQIGKRAGSGPVGRRVRAAGRQLLCGSEDFQAALERLR